MGYNTRIKADRFDRIFAVVMKRLKNRDGRAEKDERQMDIDGYDIDCLEEIIDIIKEDL
jgi:hypothetical protein